MKTGAAVSAAVATSALAAGLAFATVLLSDKSPAWPAVFAVLLAVIGAMFWTRDLTRACFMGFLLTLPIDIAKSILPPDIIFYYPGLWVSLSDTFLFGFLLFWWVGRKLIGHEPVRRNPLTAFALVYLGYLWFSGLIAASPGAGMAMAVTYTKFVIGFIAVADYIRTLPDLRLALKALGVGLALQVAMVTAQVATRSYLALPGMNLADTGNLAFSGGVSGFRPTGFMKHPIALADYFVFVLPPAFALLMSGRKSLKGAWVPTAIISVGACGGLLATLSRGGWVAIIVSVSFLLLISVRRSLIRRQAVMGGLVVLVVLLCITAIVYPASYLRLVESDQRSSEGRLLMIDQALMIGNAHPVLGVGLGGYHRASKSSRPASFATANEVLREAIVNNLGVVHNKYLLVYAEHGLVGLLLLILLLWKSVRIFFAVKVWNDRPQQLLGLGIASALIGQAVMYLFDHFYLEVGLMIFWVFAALLVSLARMQHVGPVRGGVFR